MFIFGAGMMDAASGSGNGDGCDALSSLERATMPPPPDSSELPVSSAVPDGQSPLISTVDCEPGREPQKSRKMGESRRTTNFLEALARKRKALAVEEAAPNARTRGTENGG